LPNFGGSDTINAMSEADLQPDAQTPDGTVKGDSPIFVDMRIGTVPNDRSPFAEQLCVPQFGILHLMIWTAVTAVLLKLFMAITAEPIRQLPTAQLWVSRISQSVYAILWGSILVGSGALVRLRCYTMPKKLQPGHWLVLILTLDIILQLAIWLPYRLFEVVGMRAIGVGMSVVNTLIAAACVFAFVELRNARRWKILIGAKGLGAGTTAAGSVLSFVTMIGFHNAYPLALISPLIRYCPPIWTAAVLIMLLAAAILDLWHRAARDWVHWLGVGALGVTYAMTFAWEVYLTFFFRTA
jgi:hypothetical protein